MAEKEQKYDHIVRYSLMAFLTNKIKVATVRRDFFPWIGRIHESGILNLIVDVLIFVERECPT